MASTLLAEIADNKLQACLFIEVHCRAHGDHRAAIENEPTSHQFPCPVCGAESAYSVLGAGGTIKPLPLIENPQNVYGWKAANARVLTLQVGTLRHV